MVGNLTFIDCQKQRYTFLWERPRQELYDVACNITVDESFSRLRIAFSFSGSERLGFTTAKNVHFLSELSEVTRTGLVWLFACEYDVVLDLLVGSPFSQTEGNV